MSVPATALRLEELELAERGLYDSILNQPAAEFVPEGGGGGGRASWPGVRISERGAAYSSVIYDAWRRRMVSTADAARVMSMPSRYVPLIGESLSRRRGRFG